MNITEMSKIRDGATEGPWYWEHNDAYVEGPATSDSEYYGPIVWGKDEPKRQKNAKFIATFDPILVGKLLDVYEQATRQPDCRCHAIEYPEMKAAIKAVEEHE